MSILLWALLPLLKIIVQLKQMHRADSHTSRALSSWTPSSTASSAGEQRVAVGLAQCWAPSNVSTRGQHCSQQTSVRTVPLAGHGGTDVPCSQGGPSGEVAETFCSEVAWKIYSASVLCFCFCFFQFFLKRQ